MKEHLSNEELLEYLESPESEVFGGLRRHLISCLDCREKTRQLAYLIKQMPNVIPYITQDAVELSDDVLQLIHNSDQGEAKRQLQEYLEKDPKLLKSALYYALSRQESVSASGTIPVNKELDQHAREKTSLISSIKALFSMKTPLWINLPAALAAGLIASLALNVFYSQEEAGYTRQIASYQDEAIVSFRNTQALTPGIGFFDRAREETQSYNGLSITWKAPDQLYLHWPAIANAKNYVLEIYQIQQGSKTLLENIGTEQTSAIVAASKFMPNNRYLWKLSGLTINDKSFEASGGFVINQLQ